MIRHKSGGLGWVDLGWGGSLPGPLTLGVRDRKLWVCGAVTQDVWGTWADRTTVHVRGYKERETMHVFALVRVTESGLGLSCFCFGSSQSLSWPRNCFLAAGGAGLHPLYLLFTLIEGKEFIPTKCLNVHGRECIRVCVCVFSSGSLWLCCFYSWDVEPWISHVRVSGSQVCVCCGREYVFLSRSGQPARFDSV